MSSSTHHFARRKSDAAATKKAAPEHSHLRRKTMGASPAMNKNLNTPSKHQVNLGSDHAAAYYFGDHGTTPAAKQQQHRKSTTPARNSHAENETVVDDVNMADTSMLSEASTSSSGSDLLNKSVLSDTTELTASNFVLQASSRQRLLEMSAQQPKPKSNNDASSSMIGEQEKETSIDDNGENSGDSARNATTAGGHPPAKSPSLKSRLGESPASLKQLSLSLRKEKQQQQHRSAVSFMLPPSPVITNKAKNSGETTTTVEIETANDKPLGDVLNHLQPPSIEQREEGAEMASTHAGTCLSPSSTIASNMAGTPKATLTSTRQATPFPKKQDASFSSPTSTRADDASHFRLGSSSHNNKKLTPTKLSHSSPRRIVNPESVDSPARNTRSAAKKSDSPAANAVVLETLGGATKRGREESQEETVELMGQATLSIRPGNVGRLSELTLSPSLTTMAHNNKRSRRSSIAPIPPPAIQDDSTSVHSSSTASTADLQNLLGEDDGPTKTTVTGGIAPSPAATTADISIPRSILNSSTRRSLVPGSSSRKSVVFGSPEAAEYRVGSPSVSLTPMPRGAAKAMFTMPSARSQSSSESSVSEMDDDATMKMEAALLQNAAAAEPKDMDTSVDSNEDTPATKNGASAPPLGQPEEEEETVELEPNIEGLFSSAFGSPHSSTASMLQSGEKSSHSATAAASDNKDHDSPAESVDMTDAQSIASIASSRSGTMENLEASSQKKLNFDSSSDKDEMTVGTFGSAFQSVGSGKAQGEEEEEDNTIELEADLTSLLASTGGGTTRQTPKPVTLSKKFPKIDSNLVPQTHRMSFGDALVGKEDETQTFHQDTLTDASVTKELESNMESLIQATGGNTPSASRRRSSHRFSLTPGTKVNLSMEEEMQVDNEEVMDESMTAENQAESEQDATVLELDNKEIMTAAGLPLSPSSLEISDLLVNANTSSEDFRNPLVAEAMAGFLHAVCGEVEMKAESSADGDSCFNTIVQENSAQLLELQTMLRSSDALTASQGKGELKRLAQSAQAFVEFEWHSWEVQVVDSLAKALDGIGGEFEESEERLMSSMTLADDALEAVSLMEGRAVQRARRQSMSRRKTASKSLEAEIALLEQEIAREKAALETMQAKQHTQVAGKVALRDHLALSEKIKPSTALAESLQHRYLTLNGMHSWSPLVIDETNIVVGFIGASAKTCIKVGFSFDKTGSVGCQASVEPSFFRQRRGKKLKLTPLITEYVVANMEVLVESIRKTKLNRASDIVGFLQELEIRHGRLETTALELVGLHKRYSSSGGVLMEADPVGNKSDFLLSVDFTSLSDDSTALRATFELNSLYPFVPLNISLDDREGKVDVESMRRQLVKSAKPGFGYVSRTCDTVAAFLR